MAVFCLATGLADLRARLGRMTLGYTYAKAPVTVDDLGAAEAMTLLLKDALKPNLVQSIGGTPAPIHGGPFANIAHGCNSAIATNTARTLADVVVTEAGFDMDPWAPRSSWTSRPAMPDARLPPWWWSPRSAPENAWRGTQGPSWISRTPRP